MPPLVRLLRPQQWVKNVFIFAGPIFGKKLITPDGVDWPVLLITIAGFLCLSLVSSVVYIINDVHDRDEDRMHPRKRLRPVASGAVSVFAAISLAALLMVLGMGGAFTLDAGFGIIAAVYFVMQILYTFLFKHSAVLDVIIIGLGFVLRAVSGAVLVAVAISPWLIICTFTLCLFMGFSKRRCELKAMEEGASGHRRTLALYTPQLLNHMTTMTAAIAVLTFLLYAMSDRTIHEFGTNYLVYTLPMVVYAIFRFAMLVEHGEVDGPTDVLLRDHPFQAALVLWVIAAMTIVYRGETVQAWLSQLR